MPDPIRSEEFDQDLISSEILLKAIVQFKADEAAGVGFGMLTALEAVAQDIINRHSWIKYLNNHSEELMGHMPTPPVVAMEVTI